MLTYNQVVSITEKLHRRLANENVHASQGSLEYHLTKVLDEEGIAYEPEPEGITCNAID